MYFFAAVREDNYCVEACTTTLFWLELRFGVGFCNTGAENIVLQLLNMQNDLVIHLVRELC